MTSSDTHPNSPENRRAGILTNALLIAAVCVLPLIRDPWALDSSKVPRLLALNILLAGFFAMMVSRAWRHCLDWSAARHRVLLAFAAYTISVWASLFQAGNVSAGLIDACLASATPMACPASSRTRWRCYSTANAYPRWGRSPWTNS